MAYLHSDREQFRDAIDLAYEQTGVMVQAIEKDYYVTMLLRLLAQKMPYIVFKGGTSLSKCHKVIRRFSEDIDITIDTLLSQGQKKKIKQAIVESAEELGMTIENLDETRSRRDYNRYVIAYDSVIPMASDALKAAVLLETSYTAVSFPTVLLPVHSYIGDMMEQEAPDVIEEYNLNPFEMKVQGIDRTLADKVFAVCDYYLQGKVAKLYTILLSMPCRVAAGAAILILAVLTILLGYPRYRGLFSLGVEGLICGVIFAPGIGLMGNKVLSLLTDRILGRTIDVNLKAFLWMGCISAGAGVVFLLAGLIVSWKDDR